MEIESSHTLNSTPHIRGRALIGPFRLNRSSNEPQNATNNDTNSSTTIKLDYSRTDFTADVFSAWKLDCSSFE